MNILTYLLIGLIKLYKLFISPMFSNNSCRFEPTCSSYCIDALKTYGLFKGISKSILRIARCNHWYNHNHNYDHVVKQKEIK